MDILVHMSTFLLKINWYNTYMTKLNGYKTYIGIGITFLGVIGFGGVITEGDISQIIDLVSQLVGLGIAIYGRYDATRRAK
jgi:hypothetical protein